MWLEMFPLVKVSQNMLISTHILLIWSTVVSFSGVNWLVFRKATKPFEDLKKKKTIIIHKIFRLFSFLVSHKQKYLLPQCMGLYLLFLTSICE